MMTIKIIRKCSDDVERTSLLEGENILYNYDHYENYVQWRDLYSKETDEYNSSASLFMDKVSEGDGGDSLLVLKFRNASGEIEVCFIKYSMVFIMQDGKTIDKISC